MDDIKSAVCEIFRNILEEAVMVAEHLCDAVGVDVPEDLALVEPSDLMMLKQIQVRKLIQG